MNRTERKEKEKTENIQLKNQLLSSLSLLIIGLKAVNAQEPTAIEKLFTGNLLPNKQKKI